MRKLRWPSAAVKASALSSPHANHLLETLPNDVYERLRDVYFPTSAIMSLLPRDLAIQGRREHAEPGGCNRHHTVDKQLCRWLLVSLDRLPSNDLSMTQQLIADMLGVRREGVTEAAGKLHKAGLISSRCWTITLETSQLATQLGIHGDGRIQQLRDRATDLRLVCDLGKLGRAGARNHGDHGQVTRGDRKCVAHLV